MIEETANVLPGWANNLKRLRSVGANRNAPSIRGMIEPTGLSASEVDL